MMNTAYERIAEYVTAFNNARSAGDIPTAIEMGKLAVRDAQSELQRPGLIDAHKIKYNQIVSIISEFLANPNAKPAAPAAAGGGAGKHDESKIKETDWFAAPIPQLNFSDIAGLKDVRDEFVVNIFAPMDPKYADIYRKYRGDEQGLQVLLYGPPGTGKTHVVKCLAGQMGCKIAVVQIKDVMANLVGDGAKIISAIFEQAKKYDKCIIFFDEIDAIASDREGDDSRHTKEQLTTLLTNMDGFTSKANPGQIRIVIAATNRPWALDSAVKRGGRFDTQIYVPLPDPEARLQLIRLALGKDPKAKKKLDIPLAPDVSLEWLVERTQGYAGADIKSICRQAASRPLRREIMARGRGEQTNDCITREDFEYAFSRYINSTTTDDLMRFQAYKDNAEYNDEYKMARLDWLLKATYQNHLYSKGEAKQLSEIAWYEEDWFWDFYENGKLQLLFQGKYDLSFLDEEYKKYLEKSKKK